MRVWPKYALWLLWWSGVALIPIAAAVVARGASIPLVVNNLGAPGLLLFCFWGVAYAAMFAAMVGLRGSNLRAVLAAQGLASIIVATSTIATPSSDPFAYLTFGRVLAQHGNPWRMTQISHDPITQRASYLQKTRPPSSAYGPFFVLVQSVLSRFISDAWKALVAERLLFGAAALAVTFLLRGPAIAWWGLHPLVLFEFACGAHNDALILACVALAMRVRMPAVKGALIGLAAMVKLIAAPGLIFITRRRALLGSVIGFAAVVAVFAIAIPSSLDPRGVQHVAAMSVGTPAHILWRILEALRVPRASTVAQVVVALAVIALASRMRWRRRDAAPAACILLLAASPYITLWYVSWPLFGATWCSNKLRLVVLTLTASGWFLYIGPFSGIPIPISSIVTWGAVVVAALLVYRRPQLRFFN